MSVYFLQKKNTFLRICSYSCFIFSSCLAMNQRQDVGFVLHIFIISIYDHLKLHIRNDISVFDGCKIDCERCLLIYLIALLFCTILILSQIYKSKSYSKIILGGCLHSTFIRVIRALPTEQDSPIE